MIFSLYRCLKSGNEHFHEIGQLTEMESEYYHYLRFINGDEIIFTREEVSALNYIDTNTNQAYEEVTQEQHEFMELFK